MTNCGGGPVSEGCMGKRKTSQGHDEDMALSPSCSFLETVRCKRPNLQTTEEMDTMGREFLTTLLSRMNSTNI